MTKMKTMMLSKWIMIVIHDPKDSSKFFYRIQSDAAQYPIIDSSWILVADANDRLKELRN